MSSLWVALLCAAGSTPSAEAGAVPLRLAGGFAVVEGVFLNGTGPYRFLLDTGAQSSAISKDVAAGLGIQPEYAVIRVTTGSEEVVPAYVAAEVAVGPVRARRLELMEASLHVVRRAVGQVDGILGQNFLGQFPWLLDRERGTLVFDLDHSVAARLSGRRTKVASADGRMLVPARVDGKEVPLVLDSGASHLILFEKARLRSPGPVNVDSNGGAQMAISGFVASVLTGDVELAKVPAALMQGARRRERGLLPASLFRSIYADAQSGFVILNPR